MATPVQLATGLGGVIGSDYVQSSNRLYFVEFNGKVSVLDLVRALDTVVFTGDVVMPADSSLDLTNGTSAQGGHIRWDHTHPAGARVMRPQGNCELSLLGPVNYGALNYAGLQTLHYSQDSLYGNNDPNNQLVNGAVFGVYNGYVQPAANFDYAKVQVLQYGANLHVRWATYRLRPRYHVLGTGYNQPEDIIVTAGGRYAYVTERAGNLLRVDLTNANRAAATVVASGMNAPHQVALDEGHGQAYVVEYTNPGPGQLWRIDLSSGVKTALFTGLQGATGLLVSADSRFAYVAEQAPGGGRVRRIDLTTGIPTTLTPTLTNPFFMEWADPGQSHILLPERDPANQVTKLDLTQSPVSSAVLQGVPFRPSSLVLTTSNTMIVCCDQEIDQYDLAAGTFSSSGPILQGVGLVPIDHIINAGNAATDGYADTTDNPAYILVVKDAPFGGTLAIMINHQAAYGLGARYYKLLVDGAEPRQSFSDYLWNSGAGSFLPQSTGPDPGGFYPVRAPGQVWYNPNLGYMLDTTILSNGLHSIDVKLYQANHTEIAVASIHNRQLKIDNQWPVASIDGIFHDGAEVDTCAIVSTGTDQFTFQVTATDPQGHMLSWSLVAVWGNNKSASVDGDAYSAHISPTRQWAGTTGVVPSSPWHATVAGDATSTQCAHTFWLTVWDRVINGYGYFHEQTYTRSITIWL